MRVHFALAELIFRDTQCKQYIRVHLCVYAYMFTYIGDSEDISIQCKNA
jgi:hypothetical protein